MFKAALGFSADDAEALADLIRQAIAIHDAILLGDNEVGTGTRYRVDFDVPGQERIVTIRTGWNVDQGSETVRLTTCFVLEG
ncbi:DUF6883 domain-containing protein [Gloeobacter kilaueensis]|uniref:DUF6883 domain-containing protein n=1 Tax=Gloeobacter kilaueensis (strain ATCC BAA-2537 / CCAP 1431/1 / ULC 316 / JS1) TaxID=1183438 RepID=U5QME4_GLOK1|nr:DUF6883 domain-containing protein [Gloeobacter kilaueensis]AGY60063.1 hypothetical protein GKIL_3817 [Gloeobacter kilaueensis JS1]